MNKIYAFPILWGLGFLAVRHFGQDGDKFIAYSAFIGIISIGLACTLIGKTAERVR